MWPNLVGRPVWDREVESSNLSIQTKGINDKLFIKGLTVNVTYCKLSVSGEGRVEYHLYNADDSRPIAMMDRHQATHLMEGIKSQLDKKIKMSSGGGKSVVTITTDNY